MVRLFLTCLGFWLLLSGHRDPFHLAAGALAASLVVRLNRHDEAVSELVGALPALARYVPWLLVAIVRASVDVARRVLDPRLPIDHGVVRLRTLLASDLARTTLANSITLTPGTVTLDVDGEDFAVHALTRSAAGALPAMRDRVANVFGGAGTVR